MWAKIDDGFFDHPKARAAGKDGRALFIASLCWSGSSLTAGVIDRSVLPLLAAKAEVRPAATARRLVDAGLWKIHPDGWEIHDYLDYNPSPDKVRDIRQKRAEAGRRGGTKSKPPDSKPEANCLAKPEAESKPNRTPSPSPSPNHPQTTSSGSRSDQWRDERNKNSNPGNPMVSDWATVRRLASQGNHTWRDHPDLSEIARRAASEVAVTIRYENENNARVAFYEAWKQLALEGVS